jgi:hypothetical protein
VNLSATGVVFDTISEMSTPSFDMDGARSEITPIVNMGDPNDQNVIDTAIKDQILAEKRRVKVCLFTIYCYV